jgi:hypothetical protein
MELRVHLKVCESCGCLWYRAQAEIGVYCSSCQDRLKDFPTAQSRRPRGRPRKLTLPTVFAVHAPADSDLDFALDNSLNNPRSFPQFPGSRTACAAIGGAR